MNLIFVVRLPTFNIDQDLEELEERVLTKAATMGMSYKPIRKKGTIGKPKTPHQLKVC